MSRPLAGGHSRQLLRTLFLLISLVLLPKVYAISPAPVGHPSIAPKLAQDAPVIQTSPSAVRAYVVSMAKELGVNPVDAAWIVAHESQDGINMRGDDGQSRGFWMISNIYHPEVSNACADDLQCSTDWSLKWIIAGHIEQWSTWRLRFKLYLAAQLLVSRREFPMPVTLRGLLHAQLRFFDGSTGERYCADERKLETAAE
jgi:hypothetical protein